LIRQATGYILDRGSVEVKLFQNIYTQTQKFDRNWEIQDLDQRSTFYTGSLEILYGLDNRVNIGADVFYKAVLNHEKEDLPAEVLAFQKNQNAHHAFNAVFPKIKWLPFEGWDQYTIEAGFFIPIASDQKGMDHDRPYLAAGQYEFWVENFYVHNIGSDFQLFGELDAYWRMGENELTDNTSAFRTPVKAFFSYFFFDRWSAYAMAEFNPTWGDDLWSSAYNQNGLGVKYQLTNSIEAELLYTDFTAGKNGGAGKTFNLGLRFQN
jgi:hypothetical protein